MKPVFAALVCAFSLSRAVASPAMISIPVGPSYSFYATSRDARFFEKESDRITRVKGGFPMSVYSASPKREREAKIGYATVFATWAQTTLRVPLGWTAVDAKENVDESRVLSPGKTVRIVARAALDNQTNARRRNAFGELKLRAVAQTRARLVAQKLNVGQVELLDAPNGAFVVRALDVRDSRGKRFSFLEHFAQRATAGERQNYWAKVARQEPLSPLPLPQAMSLLAPSESFDKYLGLFGLMLRDRGVNWAREESLSLAEFSARSGDARRMVQLADEAVALLRENRVDEFFKRFPDSFPGEARVGVEKRLRQTTVPFFGRLPKTPPTRTNVSLVSDADPQEPLFRAQIVRTFVVGETSPAFMVALDRVDGKISLLGIVTTDDPMEG